MAKKVEKEIEELKWENSRLEWRVKERTKMSYTYLGLFLFLLVVFVIIVIQNSNMQQENNSLKSQITLWDLKIHCSIEEEFSGFITGTTDFDLKFKDYESYKLAKKEILSNLKGYGKEVMNCEVIQ